MRSLWFVAIVFLSACVSQPLPEGFKDRDDFDPVAAAKTRISLGLTYLKNGNYTQAKFNLDKALQFAPRLADAHYSMAYYYQQVDEMALANDAYQEALDRAPNNPDIANSYGAFLCQQGQYNKAKSYFLKAVNASNYISTAETFENLALCSHSQGELKDAIEYLNAALNHQPGRAKSLLLLVQIQIEQQLWQEAKANLRRYERVASVSPETLWLSITIERELGNTQLVQGYGDMLIRMYPDHPYTLDYVENRKQFISSPNASSSQDNKTYKQLEPELTPGTEHRAVDEQQDTPPVAQVQESNVQASGQDKERQDPQKPIVAVSDDERAAARSMINSAAAVPPTDETQNTPAKTLSSDSTQQQGEAEQAKYHVVQKGENLYRISIKYNVKIQRLVEWNQLDEDSSIYVGKKLIVVDPKSVE